jgi:FkbM family methyltransferase
MRSGIQHMSSLVGKRLTSALLSVRGSPPAHQAAVPEPLPADEYDLVQVDAGRIWISHKDQVMRPYMQRAGCWDPDEGALLRSLTSPGCRFLDIGANVGYFSVLVGKAAPGVTVDSVEPDPGNVRALRFNLWANQIPGRVWPVALDDRDRALELSGNEHNLGDLRSDRVIPAEVSLDSRVKPEERVSNREKTDASATTGTSWIVPAASGAELYPNRIFDLVKVDVQGWEYPVLLGLDQVLRRAPVAIVSEFWPAPLRATGREPIDILARYRDLGYRIRTQVGAQLRTLSDAETVEVCDSAGIDGQVNILLER